MTVTEQCREEELDWNTEDMPDLPQPDEAGRIIPQFIPNDQIAEDTLRHWSYWQRERERVVAMAARERARIDDLERRQLERIDRHRAWHESGLRAFLEASGKRVWKGLRGTLSWRAGRERVEVRDEAAFLRWADLQGEDVEQELVTTTVTPCKSGIAAWIKGAGAGELPPGVELVRGETALAIRLEG